MEASHCHTSHIKSFVHYLHSKDSSSQKDRWTTPQLDIHKKHTFRSKRSAYTDPLSPDFWSLEDYTKHGKPSYSQSMLAPTLEQLRPYESSSVDDLSASWSSVGSSRSSMPSPDLDDQGHSGWLAEFYSYSSSSSPKLSRQRLSPATTFLPQQIYSTEYTNYLQPNIPDTSTPDTYLEATAQTKMKNWEMAFDWYDKEETHPTTATNTRHDHSAQIDSNIYSSGMNSEMTEENEFNNQLKTPKQGTPLNENQDREMAPLSEYDAAEITDMDASDWNKMGMDLQEMDQDADAIEAFRHAVDMDVTMLDAWLNLAVSYTNEHQRGNVYDCLEAWLQHNVKYQHISKMNNRTAMMTDRNTALVERFILAARCAPGGTSSVVSSSDSPTSPDTALNTHPPATNEIDADVQVILGLLFYLADETQKSIDCFRTALACRPDDHRLWNQLGSVMLSHQGNRASETSCIDTMDMYWSALYLNPEYTRARYNLAVVHMKLSQYEQAAYHLVTALTYQQKQQQQRTAVISSFPSSMWSSLRLVMYMLNFDHLADACNRYDLTPFAPFLNNTCTLLPHMQ